MYQLKIKHKEKHMSDDYVHFYDYREMHEYVNNPTVKDHIEEIEYLEYTATYADVIDRLICLHEFKIKMICDKSECNFENIMKDLDDIRMGRKSLALFSEYKPYYRNTFDIILRDIDSVTNTKQTGLRWHERNQDIGV